MSTHTMRVEIRKGLIALTSGLVTLFIALVAAGARPTSNVFQGFRDVIYRTQGVALTAGASMLVLGMILFLLLSLAGLGVFLGNRVRRIKARRDGGLAARHPQTCDEESTLLNGRRSRIFRRLRIALALLLLSFSGFIGYAWYHVLLPGHRTFDHDWAARVSQREYWRQYERRILRCGWFHDDGFIMSYYGDESSMRWLISMLRPGTILNGCMEDGPVHADHALRGMSNQDVGRHSDAWLAWWDRNADRSQVEWIEDGFRDVGLDVEHPPSEECIRALLLMLGERVDEAHHARPFHLRYNAFRWLRDSGFEAVAHALSIGHAQPDLAHGLLAYASFERAFPADGAGILDLLGDANEQDDSFTPRRSLSILDHAAAQAAIFGPALASIVLLLCSRRKRNDRQ